MFSDNHIQKRVKTTEFLEPVYLRVYDISEGAASTWSPVLLGKKIYGVWHTGIVVYGHEYFYGGRIVKMRPKDVEKIYGIQVYQKHQLGATRIKQSQFEAYLLSIQDKFSRDCYDLIKWNCNNFTNHVSQYLIEKPIPAYILNLPEELTRTFIGKVIIRFIRMFSDAPAVDSDAAHHPRHTLLMPSKEESKTTSKTIINNSLIKTHQRALTRDTSYRRRRNSCPAIATTDKHHRHLMERNSTSAVGNRDALLFSDCRQQQQQQTHELNKKTENGRQRRSSIAQPLHLENLRRPPLPPPFPSVIVPSVAATAPAATAPAVAAPPVAATAAAAPPPAKPLNCQAPFKLDDVNGNSDAERHRQRENTLMLFTFTSSLQYDAKTVGQLDQHCQNLGTEEQESIKKLTSPSPDIHLAGLKQCKQNKFLDTNLPIPRLNSAQRRRTSLSFPVDPLFETQSTSKSSLNNLTHYAGTDIKHQRRGSLPPKIISEGVPTTMIYIEHRIR